MANRTKVLETLDQYFKTKGRVLSSQEYSRETDTPVRLQQIRNIFGSWNRLEKLLMAKDRNADLDAATDVNEVIRARNDALNAAREQWLEASENQDAKALREAQAQYVAEQLAKNAATPEGANANKIAMGGPLPKEQPRYDVAGATVNVDPATKEQTVVDIEPETFDVTDGGSDPRTPTELRDAVAAAGVTKTGNVKTGKATDGGSQGEAPISAVSALGGEGTSDGINEKPVVDTKGTEKKS